MILETLINGLIELFEIKKLSVNISDHFVNMKGIIKASELIKKSDIIIIGSPHSKYKNLKIPKTNS